MGPSGSLGLTPDPSRSSALHTRGRLFSSGFVPPSDSLSRSGLGPSLSRHAIGGRSSFSGQKKAESWPQAAPLDSRLSSVSRPQSSASACAASLSGHSHVQGPLPRSGSALRQKHGSDLWASSPAENGRMESSAVEPVPAIPGVQAVLDAFTQQPATWPSALIVTTTVFTLGYPGLASGLSLSGIGAAYILGLLVWRAFGFQGFVTVCLYFAIGTAVTKVRMKQKEKEGIAEKRKGRRGPASVVGSGFAGALCSLVAIFLGATSASSGSLAWVYQLLQLGFVASFCTKLSDTTSSEIGKAYGKATFLVTTLEPVPRGSEGAISLEGTLAGLAAAVLLAALALACGEVSLAGAGVCVVASQIANYGESYIGATLQDKPGYEWLNNDVVNVCNILTGAGVAMAAGYFLPL